MSNKRRSGPASTKTSISDEIAHLRGLDLKGLHSRWQSVFQRLPPDHLPRHFLFAIIAYRIQADRLGDLDHETKQVLDRTDAKDTGATMSTRLVSFDQKRTELTPGTVLVREWDRHSPGTGEFWNFLGPKRTFEPGPYLSRLQSEGFELLAPFCRSITK